jgi:hypothetical protein
VSYSVSVSAGQIGLKVGSRTLRTPALAAGQLWRLDVAERGRRIVGRGEVGCPAGTMTVYLLDARNRPLPIATGTVT